MSVKKLIVVLGPHRSGTSLCTHAVQVCGAQTGLEKIYTSDENSKGFFEHRRIILFNEKLLAALGGSWDNPAFESNIAIANKDLGSFTCEAKALFHELFSDAECVVLKDPRLCQLLPFWESVFNACGFSRENIYYVHTLRDPVEVALSQHNRVLKNPSYYEFGRNPEEGGALWLSLTAQALTATQGRNNYLIAYQGLLRSPHRQLEKLAVFLELSPDANDIEAFCQDFVDTSLHRSRCNAEAQSVLRRKLPQIFDVYETLLPLCEKGRFTETDIQPVLDICRKETTQQAILHAQVEALSRLNNRHRQIAPLLSAANTENEALKTENEALKTEIEALNNRSFRNFARQAVAASKRRLSNFFSAGMRLPILQRGKYIFLHARGLPLRAWIGIRARMVLFSMTLNQKHPKSAYYLRRTLSPLVRIIDRTAFRLCASSVFSSSHINSNCFYSRYQQKGIIGIYEPLVTVIVPNYNHATYLEERLESIYQQSYRNFEVILMDDCSKDDSVRILQAFKEKYPQRTRLELNEKNSGGVFHQWEKGIKLAKGDIIWIAESDEYCSNDFLDTLVPMFRNEAVMLAFARTAFVRGTEKKPFWSLNEYLHDIDATRWAHPFIETAHNIVNAAFAIKNIIPNVSSALFRKTEKLEIIYDPEWKKMKTCGDWMLYLHLIRGGMLAYSPAATNYYRIHDKNTSISSYAQDAFYQEHEFIARTIRRYYDVPMETLQRQKQQLIAHWQQSRDDYSKEKFDGCYSLERVEQDVPQRTLNLLMAGYGFCAGGGETFPILLANLMKAQGYNVTFLDCNQAPRIDSIRRSLRSDIPLVTALYDINQIVRDFRIDLVHSHHAWVDCSIVELLDNSSGCKTVVTMHGMYEIMDKKSASFHLPRLKRHAAQIVYTAEKNLEAVRAHNLYDADMMTRIDNALEIYPVKALDRTSINVSEDAFLLTLVSRAIAEKGWQEAVEAVGRARELTDKDIHLVLIGEGPAYDKLKGQQLPPYVHLEGFRKNIREYFAASNIGFLPTYFKGESFPLVIIDCLHTGTPVLASSIGEIPYMVQTDNGAAGMLFDLHEDWSIDIEVLAEKIAKLATDKTLYDSLKENASYAAAKFNPIHLCNAYDTVYQRALAEA